MGRAYSLRYHPTVLKKDLECIPWKTKAQIKFVILERICLNPTIVGRPLKGPLTGAYRVRVGLYRIIYVVQEYDIVIFAISRRSQVYRIGRKRLT